MIVIYLIWRSALGRPMWKASSAAARTTWCIRYPGHHLRRRGIHHSARRALDSGGDRAGVHRFLGKLVPNARPALDYPVVYPYALNAVLIGFLFASLAGWPGYSCWGGFENGADPAWRGRRISPALPPGCSALTPPASSAARCWTPSPTAVITFLPVLLLCQCWGAGLCQHHLLRRRLRRDRHPCWATWRALCRRR